MSFLSNKNILIVSPESWDHLFVSKHHYAIALADRGNKVFFLNPPSSRYEITKTDYANLLVLNYKGFWKGAHKMPKLIRGINLRYVYKKLEHLAKAKFDIIWSFDNSVFFDFDSFSSPLLKISHIVDLNQDFNTKRASTSADICLGVVPVIVERHKKYNLNSYHIKHGVSLKSRSNKKVVTLPGDSLYKALYFGNLQMPHLDWQLLEEALNRFSSCDFVLMGSNQDRVPERIRKFSNLYLKESVPSAELPFYMNEASLLLLFYSDEYYHSYASPHKMMEYLHSGKPILTRHNKDHESYAGLIYEALSKDEWLYGLNEIIDNLEAYSSEELAIARRNIALDNTYEKQIDRIEKLIIQDRFDG